jgi:pimeloyl-ACP methyl ester carboxylesterase
MLLRGIPGARLVVYEGVSHAVHLAQPDRVIGDLVDFLAKAVSTTSP